MDAFEAMARTFGMPDAEIANLRAEYDAAADRLGPERVAEIRQAVSTIDLMAMPGPVYTPTLAN